MLKHLEQSDPQSCWNRARPDELVFVLLERDEAAPAAVWFWAEERVRLGKNSIGDAQIQEALDWASQLDQARKAAQANPAGPPLMLPPE